MTQECLSRLPVVWTCTALEIWRIIFSCHKTRQDWSHLFNRGGEMKHPAGCGIDLPNTELSHPKCQQLYHWQTWGQTHPCSLCCRGPSLWPVSLLTPSNSSCLSFPDVCSYLPHLSGTCALSHLVSTWKCLFWISLRDTMHLSKLIPLPRLCSIWVSTLLTISPSRIGNVYSAISVSPNTQENPSYIKGVQKRFVIWILNSMVFIIWFYFNWEALFNTVGILPWASAVLLFLQNYLILYPFCGWSISSKNSFWLLSIKLLWTF